MKWRLASGEAPLSVSVGFVGGLFGKKTVTRRQDTWEKVHVSEKFNFLEGHVNSYGLLS